LKLVKKVFQGFFANTENGRQRNKESAFRWIWLSFFFPLSSL